MNVNIFLKQFRKPTDVIIGLLKDGDPQAFGVEKLKGLSKILPQPDEVGYNERCMSPIAPQTPV